MQLKINFLKSLLKLNHYTEFATFCLRKSMNILPDEIIWPVLSNEFWKYYQKLCNINPPLSGQRSHIPCP